MNEKTKLALQLAAMLTGGMFPGQTLRGPQAGEVATIPGLQPEDVVKRWLALLPLVEAELDKLDLL